MITSTQAKAAAFVSAEEPEPKCQFELFGLSADEKPTTYEGAAVANGSIFVEMDTSTVYAFDEENELWRKL